MRRGPPTFRAFVAAFGIILICFVFLFLVSLLLLSPTLRHQNHEELLNALRLLHFGKDSVSPSIEATSQYPSSNFDVLIKPSGNNASGSSSSNDISIPKIKVKCTSDECSKASTEIMAGMNRSVDPCEDFWKYACGNLDRNFEAHFLRDNSFGSLIFENLGSLLTNISDDPRYSTVERNGASLYESCMDSRQNLDSQISTLFSNFFIDFQANFGGLTAAKFNKDKRNLTKLIIAIAKFFALKYPSRLEIWGAKFGSNPFFDIEFIFNDYIVLRPSGLGLDFMEYRKDKSAFDESVGPLDTYKIDVVKAASEISKIGLNIDPQNFLADVLRLEEDMAKLNSKQSSLKVIETTLKEISGLESKIGTFADPALFSAMHNDKLNPSVKISVKDTDYFLKLSSLILNTKPATIKYYLAARFVLPWLQYLNKLKADFSLYKNRESRMCAAIATFFLPDFWPVLDEHLHNKFSYSSFSSFFELAQNASNRLSLFGGNHDTNFALAQQKNFSVLSTSKLITMFDTIKLTGNFLDRILHILTHRNAYWSSDNFWRLVSSNEQKLFYSKLFNVFIIPSGLEYPHHSKLRSVPASLFGYLGAVGVNYVRDSSSSDSTDVLSSLSGHTSKLLADEMNSLSCSKNNNTKLNPSDLSFIDVGGSVEAFYAYKELQKSSVKEAFLPEFEDNLKLLFITFAQKVCETNTAEALKKKLMLNLYADKTATTFSSFASVAEFARTYSCPLLNDLPQNNTHLCEI